MNTKIQPLTCPWCSTELNGGINVFGDDPQPKPGDFSICEDCGEFSKIVSDGLLIGLEKITDPLEGVHAKIMGELKRDWQLSRKSPEELGAMFLEYTDAGNQKVSKESGVRVKLAAKAILDYVVATEFQRPLPTHLLITPSIAIAIKLLMEESIRNVDERDSTGANIEAIISSSIELGESLRGKNSLEQIGELTDANKAIVEQITSDIDLRTLAVAALSFIGAKYANQKL